MKYIHVAAVASLLSLACAEPEAPESQWNDTIEGVDALESSPLYVIEFDAPALRADQAGSVRERAAELGIRPVHQFTRATYGVSARLTDDERNRLATQPGVKRISGPRRVWANEVPWHLDRLDQKSMPLDGRFDRSATGAGTTLYVIDSGIDTTHPSFGGRASLGPNFVPDGRGSSRDCSGHGTAVASNAIGVGYGIATEAKAVSLRALPCSEDEERLYGETYVAILNAVEWVLANGKAGEVVNMSIGMEQWDLLDEAVRKVVAQGITVVVSAGNDYLDDACKYSPAGVREAITVGASSYTEDAAGKRYDTLAPFTSLGPCVDLFAPGEYTRAAQMGGGETEFGGTSSASPIVAGAVLSLISANQGILPGQVDYFLRTFGSTKALSATLESERNTTRKLLFVPTELVEPAGDYTVRLKSPVDGRTFGADMDITAIVETSKALRSVELIVDGQRMPLQNRAGTVEFSTTLPISTLSVGQHWLSVVARTQDGSVGGTEDQIPFAVAPRD